MIESSNPKPVRSVSRLMSRSLRVRGGLFAGVRFLVGLAVLCGIHAAATVDPSRPLDTALVSSLSAPMAALHSVPLTRLAVAPRLGSRPSDHAGAALRPETSPRLSLVRSTRSVAVVAIEQSSRSIVSRGYDATAPPALS